jgi:hypothetical protein
MGVLHDAPVKSYKGPELPEEMRALLEHYKRVKFSAERGEVAVVLTPRPPLQFSELASYKALMGVDLSPSEISLIMDIDSIFESRGDT